MIFGGKSIQQFGRCKVTKWGCKLYTDFNRKILSYRGRVLAVSEAPTVRTVSADILVLARDSADVKLKTNSIAKWLYESGQSRLISSKDGLHYYKARCTDISIPEYSGATATLTATFTCTDDRLFSANSEQPVRRQTQQMNNFTFNGKHCLNDMNCVFVLDKIDAMPKANTTKYEISGLSGTVVYDDGDCPVLSQKSMQGTLYFVKSKEDMSLMTQQQIVQRMHEISAWLVNSKRSDLIMDNDTSRSYRAQVVDKVQLNTDDWHNGSMKLKFVLQPVAKSIQKSRWTIENVSIMLDRPYAATKSQTESTAIGYKTPIVVTLLVKSGTSIKEMSFATQKMNGQLSQLVLSSSRGMELPMNARLKIDSQNNSVSVYNPASMTWSDATRWIDSGQFPAFYPQQGFSFQISGTPAVVDISVQCNRRWV